MTVLGTIVSSTDLAAAHISDFSEAVDDRLNTMLVAGSGVTLTYDDTANTMTVASTGGGGGGGFIDAISDTPATGNPIDLTVTGTTLTANLPTTSTVRVANLGLGVAADATAKLLVLPASAGAATIRVRDSANTVNRLTYNETGAMVLDGSTSQALLRVGGSGAEVTGGMLEIRGHNDFGVYPLLVHTNITTTTGLLSQYRTSQLFSRYAIVNTLGAAPGFYVRHLNNNSTINYGDTAAGGTAAAVGTVEAVSGTVVVYSSGNASNEYGAAHFTVKMDPDGATNFPTTTPGRAWGVDVTVLGPKANQANALWGVVSLVQQQLAATPSAGPSACFIANTRSQGIENVATNPLDAGIIIAGTSGAVSADTGAGFTVGLKLGGTAGGGWIPSAQRSRITTGIQINDYVTYGIRIQNRIDPGTGQAISLGWDNAGAASTSTLDGIDFGGDCLLYRRAADALGTPSTDRFQSGGFDIVATNASGYLQLPEQSSAPGAGANLGRLYCVDNGAGKTQLFVRFGSGAAQLLATEP